MTALSKRFKMFSLSVMQSTFCLPYVKVITVPAACLVHNFRHKRTVETVLVGEKRLNAASVPENHFKVFSQHALSCHVRHRSLLFIHLLCYFIRLHEGVR